MKKIQKLQFYPVIQWAAVTQKRHYENMPIQTYWKLYNQKTKTSDNFFFIFFHISAHNMDCGTR